MKEAKPLRQIFNFPSTLFVMGTVYSHSSVQQVRKHGIQSDEAVNITMWIILHIRLHGYVICLEFKLLLLKSLVLKSNTSKAL